MRRRRMIPGISVLLLVASLFARGAMQAGASADGPVAWEQWQHVPGIVDMGAHADGSLVAMANGRLYLVSRTGTSTPFAAGPDGFSADPNAEPYFVVAPALAVDSAGCSFTVDDLFVLDLTTPPGIARVDSAGRSLRFSTLMGVDTLGGIAIDTTGRFGHRLLVTGTHDGDQTTVFAVDCAGASSILTTSAPQVEGGIAVAPPTFGAVAGDLIVSDENTGRIYGIAPDGSWLALANSGLPSGGDTGVESEGFVPRGFSNGGYAYLADRGTPDNPFPGTDSLLRISATALVSAGVQDGDLLIGTEGNGTTIAVRCSDTCTVSQVASGTNGGHIEGHIALVADRPAP